MESISDNFYSLEPIILSVIIKAYRLDGHLHREDGPAVIYSDGEPEW
jgi:protein associated with RNAse G/E